MAEVNKLLKFNSSGAQNANQIAPAAKTAEISPALKSVFGKEETTNTLSKQAPQSTKSTTAKSIFGAEKTDNQADTRANIAQTRASANTAKADATAVKQSTQKVYTTSGAAQKAGSDAQRKRGEINGDKSIFLSEFKGTQRTLNQTNKQLTKETKALAQNAAKRDMLMTEMQSIESASAMAADPITRKNLEVRGMTLGMEMESLQTGSKRSTKRVMTLTKSNRNLMRKSSTAHSNFVNIQNINIKESEQRISGNQKSKEMTANVRMLAAGVQTTGSGIKTLGMAMKQAPNAQIKAIGISLENTGTTIEFTGKTGVMASSAAIAVMEGIDHNLAGCLMASGAAFSAGAGVVEQSQQAYQAANNIIGGSMASVNTEGVNELAAFTEKQKIQDGLKNGALNVEKGSDLDNKLKSAGAQGEALKGADGKEYTTYKSEKDLQAINKYNTEPKTKLTFEKALRTSGDGFNQAGGFSQQIEQMKKNKKTNA